MTQEVIAQRGQNHRVPVWFTFATIAFLAILLGGNFLGNPWVAGLAKATASLCFIMVAVTGGGLGHGVGRWIVAGLVLSWFGDVFLIGRGDALFLAGLVSFLLAHAAYVAAFAVHGVALRWTALTAVIAAPVIGAVLIWLWPHVEDAMRGPVATYIIVISIMTVLAWGTRGLGASWCLPIGATLFFFSDIAVAKNRFVDPESMDWLWGLPLYYGGQLFLAHGAAMSRKTTGPEANG